MIKTLRSGEIVSGAFLAALGAIAIVFSLRIAQGAGGRLHPRTLPLTLGIVLLVGGGWLALRALLDRNGPAARQLIAWPDRTGWRQFGVALAAMAAYTALMEPLGFLLTTFLFVTGFIWYFGRYRPWVALLWGLGTVAFIYVLFIWLLELPFPQGLLPL